MFANVAVNEFISINPKICHGQACVRGTRIPVHQVIRMLANGDTVEVIRLSVCLQTEILSRNFLRIIPH